MKEQRILKFYTDRNYLPEGKVWITLLEPFWGRPPEADDFVDKNRFLDYNLCGKKLFSLVEEPEDADLFVFPTAYELVNDREKIREFAAKAAQHNSKLLLFFNSDSDEVVDIENTLVFRTSFYKSSQRKDEFALPGWSQDYIKTSFGGELQIRTKGEKPKVGYCGYIDGKKEKISGPIDFLRHIKRALFNSSPKVPAFQKLRGDIVRALFKAPEVETNFIIRDGFMGVQATQVTRDEFINNMIDSDYCIVTRGQGNFSYRLYEVMSCGRIPLFVNTDSVLPYDHIVNWKDYFVWIEESELPNIGEKLLDFHASISKEEFIERQKKIRELYEEWISPVGFHKNLWRCITNKIGE